MDRFSINEPTGEVDDVGLDALEGRVSAVSIIPYPPGMRARGMHVLIVAYARSIEVRTRYPLGHCQSIYPSARITHTIYIHTNEPKAHTK
jgi:hypothetical protein